VIIYMYASAWLLTTNRRYWSNASRRFRQSGATDQCEDEGALSGPVARQRSVNLTYSTSILRGRGMDFDMANPTRPFVRC
jgi:hypothetical protein